MFRLVVEKIKRENLDRETLLRLIAKHGSVPARVVVARVHLGDKVVSEQAEMESGQNFTDKGPVAETPAPAVPAKTPAAK